MAPIPAYIALDGFEQEIRVENLDERMLSLSLSLSRIKQNIG